MRSVPHDTRLGQLQRGRGVGFLAALAAPRAANDELLRCVLEDPRVDRQLETRGSYYAELAQWVDIDVAALVRRAGDGEAWLVVDVLAELVARGDPIAATLLTHPEREPAAAAAVLATLVACGEWAADHLQVGAAAFLAEHLEATGELVHAVEIDPEFWDRWRGSLWRVERAFVDAAAQAAAAAARAPAPFTDLGRLTTENLLDHARHGRVDWQHARAALARRDSEPDRAALADVVASGHDAPLLAIAAGTLAAFGDLRLLAIAEAMFARKDLDFGGVANAIERQRRAALLQYVEALPPAVVLPLARRWFWRAGFLRVAAGAVLRRHAEAPDREWLEDHVASTPGTASDRITAEIDALARIGDVRSLPVLVGVAERATSSFARTHAQRGIATHAQDARAQVALREALWDCEDEAVELACAHAVLRDSPARKRVAEIVAAPLVSAELHGAALSRALAS